MRIALITPVKKIDYLAETVIDGLISLKKEGQVEFFASSSEYPSKIDGFKDFLLDRKGFIDFARSADVVLLIWGKDSTDFSLASDINCWWKTIFIDGSELGKNRRYDKKIVKDVIEDKWQDNGKINKEMLEKCLLYFRREKPYINGIIPLPYGIESRYHKDYSPTIEKDIDFVCIFGQEEFPPLRREIREYLEDYCRKNNFSYITEKTKNQDEFYKLLSRAKVGVSVGGGGYDTARFWEILGNNCLLMTETVDIFEDSHQALPYQRIVEFDDFEGFKRKLDEVGSMIRTSYDKADLTEEYEKILKNHSSVARVEMIVSSVKNKLTEIQSLCSIVISSCDAFEDAWNPFFKLFFKYWPDCPFPIYLITNGKVYDDRRVRTITVFPDQRWASNLKEALRRIDTRHVIYMQEDYFLSTFVSTEQIIRLIKYMEPNSVSCLRLFPAPSPDVFMKNSLGLGEISKDASYRISTQAAIWDKEVLNSLLVDGETGWDFELKKNQPTVSGRFFGVIKPAVAYVKSTGIKKGRWTYDAIRLFKREGIDISTSGRLRETGLEYLKRRLRSLPVLGRVIKLLWK